jgi:hypothetical protein
MSTASAGTPSEQPQRTSQQPGPLAIFAATAIGGVLATRLGKTPFLLAAGAAAFALLKQKKAGAPVPMPQSLPPPTPEPDLPAQSQVEQWLSLQMIREKQAPVVELSTASIESAEREDDYRPQSFLLDDADEFSDSSPANNTFAGLTEPVLQQIPEPAPQMEQEAPLPPQQAQELPGPPPAADSAWTLGVEPLPSFSEAAPYVAPYVPRAGSPFFSAPVRQEASISEQESPRSSMFSSAPVQQDAPGPPLFFSTAVFEGAAFPDEISVAPPTEPVAIPTDVSPALETRQEPLNEPPSVVEAALEIQVQLAAPGDASFDPPLAAVLQNPWQPEPDNPDTTRTSPLHSQTISAVLDAEIILRPRAPTQNSVTAKSKFAPPAFGKHFSAESDDTPPAEGADDAHFPGPLQSPREPRPRTAWRSWWGGD